MHLYSPSAIMHNPGQAVRIPLSPPDPYPAARSQSGRREVLTGNTGTVGVSREQRFNDILKLISWNTNARRQVEQQARVLLARLQPSLSKSWTPCGLSWN
jgi:hypothetical protein